MLIDGHATLKHFFYAQFFRVTTFLRFINDGDGAKLSLGIFRDARTKWEDEDREEM